MTKEEFKANIEAAKTRVKSLSGVDGYQDRELETILFALNTGLRRPETGAAWDALVMLISVVRQERTNKNN